MWGFQKRQHKNSTASRYKNEIEIKRQLVTSGAVRGGVGARARVAGGQQQARRAAAVRRQQRQQRQRARRAAQQQRAPRRPARAAPRRRRRARVWYDIVILVG